MQVNNESKINTTNSITNPSESRQLVIWNGRECATYSQENLPEWKLLIKLSDCSLQILQDPAFGAISWPLHVEDIRPDAFVDLPFELYGQISQFLCPKDIFYLSLVAKRFNENFYNLLQPIKKAYENRPIPCDKIGKLQVLLPNLQKLWVKSKKSTTQASVARPFNRLQYLAVSMKPSANLLGIIRNINDIVKCSPNVKVLDLRNCRNTIHSDALKILAEKYNQIEGLLLPPIVGIPSSNMRGIFKLNSFPNLRIFSSSQSQFLDHQVKIMLDGSTNLRYVDLGKASNIDSETVLKIFKENPKLEFFSPSTLFDSQELLCQRVECCPQLKFLTTEFVDGLTQNSLCEIVEKLLNLENLFIKPAQNDSDPTAFSIPFDRMKESAKNLKQLKILSTEGTEERAIIEFVNARPNLVTLVMQVMISQMCSINKPLSDDMLFALAEKNTKLEVLDFRGPTEFTKEAFLNLIHNCKNLQVLTIPVSNFNEDELREIVQACSHIPYLIFEGGFFSNLETIKKLKGPFAMNGLFIRTEQDLNATRELLREFCKKCEALSYLSYNSDVLETESSTFEVLDRLGASVNRAHLFVDNLIQARFLEEQIQ